MMHHAGDVLPVARPLPQGMLQGVQGQLGAQRRGDRQPTILRLNRSVTNAV